MASRAVDLLITYRVIKLLVTPFEKQEAFKQGIIDKDGNVLKKYNTLTATKDKQSYTILHRFVFNLKRILTRVGLGGTFGSFAVALGLLLKEDKKYIQYKSLIESTVVQYLKETNQYDQLLMEQGEVKPIYETKPVYNCFGIDVYEKNGQLYSEDQYEKL
jgi:hypothetical protein